MRYLITNPDSGAPISVDGITLEVGETKEFPEREAKVLLNRYGFLVLEFEQGMLGAVEDDLPSEVTAKLVEQEEVKRLAEEAKYCPHCKQLLPEFAEVNSKKPEVELVGKKHGKHRMKHPKKHPKKHR
mgnify:CR=1 FL=1